VSRPCHRQVRSRRDSPCERGRADRVAVLATAFDEMVSEIERAKEAQRRAMQTQLAAELVTFAIVTSCGAVLSGTAVAGSSRASAG